MTSANVSGKNYAAEKPKSSQRKCKTTFGDRSSVYRGVTRYKTGRCEAFVWDNTDPQRKAKTTYIGGFEHEEDAARAHDLAALKLWGDSAALNFPLNDYEKDLEKMKSYTKEDYFLHIRRNMTRFAKGISHYRGVSKCIGNKKWQARLGKGRDIDSIYVGSFDTEEEAAKAYDVAAIRVKGPKAITNFDTSHYDVQAILNSTNFRIEGASKTLKGASVDDIIRKKKRTGTISFLPLNVKSSSNPNSTSTDPLSLQPTIETQTTNESPVLQHYINHFRSQVVDPCLYQNPNFQAIPIFNPSLNSGGSEQIEPKIHFHPYHEFPFHQNYNTISSHQYQNQSSFLAEASFQNPNSQTYPRFLVAGHHLASDSYTRDFLSSHQGSSTK